MCYDEYGTRRRAIAPLGLLAACLALAVSFLAYSHARSRDDELRALRGRVGDLNRRIEVLKGRSETLSTQVGRTRQKLEQKEAGIAPLAARVLKSVFTIETGEGLGSGFVAWTEDGDAYLVTANHVVESATGAYVTVLRKGGSYSGDIVAKDPANDLALVRVEGRLPGAAPLWQKPHPNTPRTGDELLLVGSPFGLEGTVTTGVVSRVTKKVVQTDAAANPGNSGGPALDRRGRVVGVLVAGGGENINFAIPIARACVKLRRC